MGLHIGFAAYFSVRLYEDRARAERVASLLVDERWPWPPWWAAFGLTSSYMKRTRSRKVVGAKGRAALLEGMMSPSHRSVELYRSSQQVDNHAHLTLPTGHKIPAPDWPQPLDTTGQTRAHDLPDGADIHGWIDLVHELMVALDVGHAVMPVWPTPSAVLADTSFIRIIVDRPSGDISLGPPPDFDRQNRRENYSRHKLGGPYVRYPRWGTYLRRPHLQQIGGLDRVREAVEPARVVDLGELAFIQLTDDPASALTADGERKRRALEAVMAPIIVPPNPHEKEAS